MLYETPNSISPKCSTREKCIDPSTCAMKNCKNLELTRPFKNKLCTSAEYAREGERWWDYSQNQVSKLSALKCCIVPIHKPVSSGIYGNMIV